MSTVMAAYIWRTMLEYIWAQTRNGIHKTAYDPF